MALFPYLSLFSAPLPPRRLERRPLFLFLVFFSLEVAGLSCAREGLTFRVRWTV